MQKTEGMGRRKSRRRTRRESTGGGEGVRTGHDKKRLEGKRSEENIPKEMKG